MLRFNARIALATLLLTATFFAGCSGGGDDDPTNSNTNTGSTSGTSSSGTTSSSSGTGTGSNTSTSTPTPRPVKTWNKDIQGNAFPGGTFEIQVNDTVHWTQKDTALHTVTSKAGAPEAFDSGDLDPVVKPTFEHKFDVLGTYDYFCERHPNMTGTITVVAVQTS